MTGGPPILVVMGVSGSGKSTIAKPVAQALGWDFQEGDELHPPANVAKMSAGIPLDDADRGPWLAAIRAWIDDHAQRGEPGVITCSALKRAYRDQLRAGRPEVKFVFLTGSAATIRERLERRTGHYMPPTLLSSQLQTLEAPAAEEDALVIDICAPIQDQVTRIVDAARSRESAHPVGGP